MRLPRTTFHRFVHAAAAALLAAAPAQCGGGSGDDCSPGSEGCACVMNTCLTGLQCLSDLCVDPGSAPTASNDATADPPTTGPATGGPTSEPPTTDGPTSEPPTTDGPTSETTTTTEPPAICGDGQVGGDEECDDANDVDDDACNGACMWNGPLVALVDEVTKPEYGTPEGEAFDERCAGVVGGIVGDEEMNANQFHAISGTCKVPTIVAAGQGYALKLPASGDLPWHGTQNGNTKTSVCDPNAVAVGYTVQLSGDWVEGVRTLCAPIALVGDEIQLGQPSHAPIIGSGDETAVFSECDPGYIVVGHHGHASSRVHGLGLRCARPVVILE